MSSDGDHLRPWTVTASRVTFADRWLRVRTDDCMTAEGVEVSPFHVIEAKDWSCIVALTKDLRLVLIREYRHARGMVIDGLPGGVIEGSDATAEEGARRELFEETGYGGGRFVPVLTTYPDPGNFTNKATGFLALDVEPAGAQALDAGESIEIVLSDFSDVLTRLAGGELRMHAVHVAALWSAAARILLGDVPGADTLRERLRPLFAKA
ncbi:MAG TPA: NUDIX hydrolase [Alphaproteobacteria bacterium]|jgi:8-oxo-dGTP pyrophosphatase MutT (NUDIX family)|nr:NUDIX hydrolase [Alphaproteobacteria bacterium]